MATIDADIIDWNKAPYSPNNKIPKQVRDALCKRFEVAIDNVEDTDRYSDLLLTDGWVISAKNNVVFVLNPVKSEDLPNNADLKRETHESGKLGAQLRRARDAAWDCEKYSELAAVAGITLDAGNGKITYKVV